MLTKRNGRPPSFPALGSLAAVEDRTEKSDHHSTLSGHILYYTILSYMDKISAIKPLRTSKNVYAIRYKYLYPLYLQS